jgi:hypothetical protein
MMNGSILNGFFLFFFPFLPFYSCKSFITSYSSSSPSFPYDSFKSCYTPNELSRLNERDIDCIEVQFPGNILDSFYDIDNGCNPDKLYAITKYIVKFKPYLLLDLNDVINKMTLFDDSNKLKRDKSINKCKLAFWIAILKHDHTRDKIHVKRMIPLVMKSMNQTLKKEDHGLGLCYIRAPLEFLGKESKEEVLKIEISKRLVKQLQKSRINMEKVKKEQIKQYLLSRIHNKLLEYKNERKRERNLLMRSLKSL